ncbi:MAG TPA: methyltransferase domain-containing protein [Anaeromyxobacteraceae bacterium]|nr:methyltransferase domain-containing protein [Anaeromyxobacteraceae bacterium]
MPESASERFDTDPRAYSDYLRTPLGSLRLELSWLNLMEHLPRPSRSPPRALDLGAGTGEMALRLAASGWSVTLVDGSRRMLEMANGAATARGLAARIECRTIDLETGDLAIALGVGAYDLVLCHCLLDYLTSPQALLRQAHATLVATGRISVIVRNCSGEFLKRLLQGPDREEALSLLRTRRMREAMYGLQVRLFDPAELRTLLGSTGFDVVAERGVRVVADHLPDWAERGQAAFNRILELERSLAESRDLGAVARYFQVIAERNTLGSPA